MTRHSRGMPSHQSSQSPVLSPAGMEWPIPYAVLRRPIIRLVHGNQGDRWNAVDYSAAEAAVQSGKTSNAVYPPGSRLVAEVLNPLHAQGFRHMHMLKPETTVALPLSIAFWPDETRKLLRAAFSLFAVKTRDDIKCWLLEKLGLAPKETFGAPDMGPDGDDMVDQLLAEVQVAIEIFEVRGSRCGSKQRSSIAEAAQWCSSRRSSGSAAASSSTRPSHSS